jgi:CDP-glucose 4,6-dehydratase
MVNNFWKEKSVLVTGHSGFKGWWLTHLLNFYGAKVFGISKQLDYSSIRPAHELSNLLTKEAQINLTEYEKVRNFIIRIKPDIIIHLAANAIVLDSYNNPYEYFLENTIGTLNLLELLRTEENLVNTKMFISTTDKVYNNNDLSLSYLENDTLWGNDPYSASKVCTEQIIFTYMNNFNMKNRIRIGRAGNVIGGGDRGNKRLVPYVVLNALKNKTIELRSPDAIRPWQHILDVIFSYISIIEKSFNYPDLAYNISPNYEQNFKVLELVNKICSISNSTSKVELVDNSNFTEKKVLKLNSSLIKRNLNIENKLKIDQIISLTIEWERMCLNGGSPSANTLYQIQQYIGEYIDK